MLRFRLPPSPPGSPGSDGDHRERQNTNNNNQRNNPGATTTRVAIQMLIKQIILLCLLGLVVMTVHTIPQLQQVLDSVCCMSDIPYFSTTMHPKKLQLSKTTMSPIITRMTTATGGEAETMTTETTATTTCLQHSPMRIHNVSHVKLHRNNNDTAIVLRHPDAKTCGKLRRSWATATTKTTGPQRPRGRSNNGKHHRDHVGSTVYSSSYASPLARDIAQHQSNCSLPQATFYMDNDFGMGSHFYLWSQALCNAWEAGYRIRTHNPVWLWLDQAHCPKATQRQEQRQQQQEALSVSPLQCYFPSAEQACPQDTNKKQQQQRQLVQPVNVSDPRRKDLRCSWIRKGHPSFLREFRAASMEYLFRHLSPLIIQEAQRQAGLLFEGGRAPENLVAVHMRWGDKFWEMDLPSEHEYVKAVVSLLQQEEGLKNAKNTTSTTTTPEVHVYLATEDPRAVQAFRRAAKPKWRIYVDRTVDELGKFRPARGNRASWTTRNTGGRAGLVALGSLLVSLEAKYFVLTTKSNWSRLLNSLRTNVVDAKCGNCTRMIDLRPGEW